jgi:hypothetical protein
MPTADDIAIDDEDRTDRDAAALEALLRLFNRSVEKYIGQDRCSCELISSERLIGHGL